MKPAKDSTAKTTKLSEPDKVDAYMRDLQHPLKDMAEALRQIILSANKEIGEEVKWNNPTFFYAGAMRPFNPKEYKRYLIVLNLHKKDHIMLVFPSGAKIEDTSGLLIGDYADGRRLALFYGIDEVKAKEKALQKVIKKWLKLLDK